LAATSFSGLPVAGAPVMVTDLSGEMTTEAPALSAASIARFIDGERGDRFATLRASPTATSIFVRLIPA
jgi:hypothetical protein